MDSVSNERLEAAKTIEDFIEGTGGIWDWDEFITATKFRDPLVLKIQAECLMTADRYPTSSGWCNDQGIELMRGFIIELRHKASI